MAQFSEVVNLSVVGDEDRSIFIGHRHVAAGRQVENGQSPASQPDIGAIREALLPDAEVVWAAMRLHVCHPGQRLPVSAVNQAADTTHVCPISLWSGVRRFLPWCGTSGL